MKIFFIGINGIGMSALAKVMLEKGHEVFGSDISKKEITKDLEEMGVQIKIGHLDMNIEGMDCVVYSSAIKKTNSEYIFAKLNNIPMIKRGELLAKLMNEKKGIAIAGTHGKTSTTSMMALALLETDPTIVVGGIIPELGTNSQCGSGEYFVAEADESDNSFLYIKPHYSLITNIEEEHMENHGTYDNLKKSFKTFIESTKEMVILNMDCKDLYNLGKNNRKTVFYSLSDKNANIYAEDIKLKENETSYNVVLEGKKIDGFKLSVPGKHNVSNSLSVIYLANKLGMNMENVKEKLYKFKGAKRRFDILHQNDVTIVDDYAHHPTEIEATLEAAKQRIEKRVIAIYQPHKYSRTKLLLESFQGTFKNADKLMLMPIYSAGENNIYGITDEDLAEKINHSNIEILKNRSEILEILRKEAKSGDMFLFMGAGDITNLAYDFKKILEG